MADEKAGNQAEAKTHKTERRCMRQRFIVGELRSCSIADCALAMLRTVAAAAAAGIAKMGRIHPSARVCSLAAVDHAAYPPSSGLCTLVCVVRWHGPPGVAWVATDCGTSSEEARNEPPIPDIVIDDFYRNSGLMRDFVRHGCMVSRRAPPGRASPPGAPLMRPTLDACIDVLDDGSLVPRCAHATHKVGPSPSRPRPGGGDMPGHDGARCNLCRRVWETAVRVVSPAPRARARSASTPLRVLLRQAVKPGLLQAPPPGLLRAPPPTKAVAPRTSNDGARRGGERARTREAPQSVSASPVVVEEGFAAPEREASSNPAHAAERPRPPAATQPSTASPSTASFPRCARPGCAAPAQRVLHGCIIKVECTAGCECAFHRTCWRACGFGPRIAAGAHRAWRCVTPDCWGTWSRVVSERVDPDDGATTFDRLLWSHRPKTTPSKKVRRAAARKDRETQSPQNVTSGARHLVSAASAVAPTSVTAESTTDQHGSAHSSKSGLAGVTCNGGGTGKSHNAERTNQTDHAPVVADRCENAGYDSDGPCEHDEADDREWTRLCESMVESLLGNDDDDDDSVIDARPQGHGTARAPYPIPLWTVFPCGVPENMGHPTHHDFCSPNRDILGRTWVPPDLRWMPIVPWTRCMEPTGGFVY